MALLKARAIENQTYVLGVNRIGEDKDLKYSGDSLLIDPMGKEILHCEAKEGLFLGEIDKKKISSVREKFPFIKDRKR
jgi:predicted amidohydrolase